MDRDLLRATLAQTRAVKVVGRVVSATGLTVRVALPNARIGDLVWIGQGPKRLPAEIVGFDSNAAITLPIGGVSGVSLNDQVEATSQGLSIWAGEALLGQVLDGLGQPIDGRGLPLGLNEVPVDRAPPSALARKPVSEVFATGIRAIDAFTTLGVGQRIGLFSGSGVGKSMLMGALARNAKADVTVVALVGERGREVREFLEQNLPDRSRTIVVVATSDAPPLERLKAAQVATAISEHFRDTGKHVLLLVDSVTRIARAQREVGLAAGEPPARRGFPPSVFTMLPRLLERSGQAESGCITAVYTVLVEGGDLEEPVADEVRGILDGHIVLDRSIAGRGRYPAIDILASLSRVMPKIASPEHLEAQSALRRLHATYEGHRDVMALGAYKAGTDPTLDRAVRAHGPLETFFAQKPEEVSSFEETVRELFALHKRL